MRKVLLATLVICMLALLSTLSMSVHATPPATAYGRWTYKPTFISRWADGNEFRYGEEVSTWTESFDGISHDVFTVVIHPSGFRNVKGLISFVGSVNGKSGTMVISFVGEGTPPPVTWSGHWVILSGTDGLENLRGQGTWWGPPTNVEYLGQIHFDPAA